MFRWLKNTRHPQFWEDYKRTFRGATSTILEETRFVVFDTETTGLKVDTDRILSIGAVEVIGNTMDVQSVLELFVFQEKFNPLTVEVHEIIKNGIEKKCSEVEALEKFLMYIRNSILVAHHASFDVEMINQALRRHQLPSLKNKVLDTGILYKKLNGAEQRHYSLDFLCDEFKIKKQDRHTALGDSFLTALVFLKILSRMKKERTVSLGDLFVQIQKHNL